jgi:plasmid maintenance system antidote protein VapI
MENLNHIHIGDCIKHELAEQERSVAWLARQIHIDASYLRKILKTDNIHVDLLLRISKVLNHNFFIHFSHIIPE